MKKFNPNSKQAIEIVRRLCGKYPELVTKSKDEIVQTGNTYNVYRMRYYKLVDDTKVCTRIYLDDKEYNLILYSEIEGTLGLELKYRIIIPINKDEYDELVSIFDYAMDTAIINQLADLDFTSNEITDMFKDEEETK